LAEPDVIGCNCSRHFMNVLLPAPLARAGRWRPGAMLKLTPIERLLRPEVLAQVLCLDDR
jgi:hypothetical protein